MRDGKPIVAVVDDDPRLLESLEDLLESGGYLTCSFSSGGSFLSSDLSAVDLLITDVGMPGIGGFELRDLLKETHPTLPVFLITGRHEVADQVRARGISEFFCKPFDAQALLAAVGRALGKGEKEGEHDA